MEWMFEMIQTFCGSVTFITKLPEISFFRLTSVAKSMFFSLPDSVMNSNIK